MIESFKHAGLREIFDRKTSRKIGRSEASTIMMILDQLHEASSKEDLVGVRGFHPLKPKRSNRYAMKVTANWRITFHWSEADAKACDVDYEDYH